MIRFNSFDSIRAPKIERIKYKVWNRDQAKLKGIETELEHLINEV